MSGFHTISLSNLDEIDHHIIQSAIQRHFDKIEVISENNNADFTFTADLMPPTPYKIGQILDIIETKLFENQFQDVAIYKNYSLDWAQSTLTIDKASFILSERERDLLVELITAGDNGCKRDHLLSKIWGYRADLETHALETQIYRLRQKIENEPDIPTRLITIDNGYKLV